MQDSKEVREMAKYSEKQQTFWMKWQTSQKTARE